MSQRDSSKTVTYCKSVGAICRNTLDGERISEDEVRTDAHPAIGVWRSRWTIENRKHYVRDVTLGEDRNQMHTGHAPQVLAALRNGLIDLWRAHGWTNIADAVRTYAASIP